jgi:hypothetical protein
MRFSSVICGVIASALAGIVVAACSGDGNGNANGEPKCLAKPVNTDCTLAYEPTFDNVWQYTLKVSCATFMCHSGATPTGSMSLEDKDQAYTNLLSKSTTGDPRVSPGDTMCGKALVRLNTKGESYSMPPTHPLPADQLCSINQWIAMGAKKTP